MLVSFRILHNTEKIIYIPQQWLVQDKYPDKATSTGFEPITKTYIAYWYNLRLCLLGHRRDWLLCTLDDVKSYEDRSSQFESFDYRFVKYAEFARLSEQSLIRDVSGTHNSINRGHVKYLETARPYSFKSTI